MLPSLVTQPHSVLGVPVVCEFFYLDDAIRVTAIQDATVLGRIPTKFNCVCMYVFAPVCAKNNNNMRVIAFTC